MVNGSALRAIFLHGRIILSEAGNNDDASIKPFCHVYFDQTFGKVSTMFLPIQLLFRKVPEIIFQDNEKRKEDSINYHCRHKS